MAAQPPVRRTEAKRSPGKPDPEREARRGTPKTVTLIFLYLDSAPCLNQRRAKGFLKIIVRTTFAALIATTLSQCVLLEPVRDPAMQLLRRGACISVDVPPITLTPERTAAERQLIGTEGEIEEDGWLIASAQSVSGEVGSARPGDGVMTERREDRRYNIEADVLEFYYPVILKYRRDELLGEGFDGLLRPVPSSLRRRSGTSDEIENAAAVADEVNRARRWIYEYERARSGASNEERERLRKEFLLRWYEAARNRSGEWIYTERKEWKRTGS